MAIGFDMNGDDSVGLTLLGVAIVMAMATIVLMSRQQSRDGMI